LRRGPAAAVSVVFGVIVGGLVNRLTSGGPPTLVIAFSGVAALTWAGFEWWRTNTITRLSWRQPVTPLTEHFVPRPAESAAALHLLLKAGSEHESPVVGLCGAGGFGKTTLATMLCSDQAVAKRFNGGNLKLTIGQETHGAALAAKINDVARFLGSAETFTDPEVAGQHLGRLLDDGPRRLLVIDDVWEAEQLRPFVTGGRRCVRLVTTRVPDVLPSGAARVTVDQMSVEQAETLLGLSLGPLPRALADRLLEATGRWPLLLAIVNGVLREEAPHVGVAVSAQNALTALTEYGPGALDVTVVNERSHAVRGTISLGVDKLGDDAAERFAELAVLPTAEVDVALVTRLWSATAGLTGAASWQLCVQLTSLSLVRYQPSRNTITVHTVVHTFLRALLGPERSAGIHAKFLDSVGSRLSITHDGTVAWWALSPEDRYWWDNVIFHLVRAARADAAADLAVDLRWVTARLRISGPDRLVADLNQIDSPKATSLARIVTRSAHLLGPTDPAHAVEDILLSRLHDDPQWRPAVERFQTERGRPALVGRWLLPDAFDPALRRVLTAHTNWALSGASSGDGAQMVTTSEDGTAAIWTGATRVELAGHKGAVTDCAVSPRGEWLITTGADGTVRRWDLVSGAQRDVLAGHSGWITGCALSSTGTRLMTSSRDGTARLWDTATGLTVAVLVGHTSAVAGCAIAPDGAWAVTASWDGTARIWELPSGVPRKTLVGHTDRVIACAIAPDGRWLVTAADDGAARVWDAADGELTAVFDEHQGGLTACAIAPDGGAVMTASLDDTARVWEPATLATRLVMRAHSRGVADCWFVPGEPTVATAGYDGTVRLWDLDARAGELTWKGHTGGATSGVFAPDGSWAVTAGRDQAARIWSSGTGEIVRTLGRHRNGVTGCAVAPDGAWVLTAGWDGEVKIWDTDTGGLRAELVGHQSGVTSCAVAPNGEWVVTAGHDGTMRTWDAESGAPLSVVKRHVGTVGACAVSPDSATVATTGWDETVRLWTGDGIETTLTGHTGWVTACRFSADGIWLATTGRDDVAKIWDLATGTAAMTLRGHRDWVTGCAFSPDARWLLTVSKDSTARVWESATGRCVALIRVEGQLNGCDWSPIGDDLVIVGANGVYGLAFLR